MSGNSDLLKGIMGQITDQDKGEPRTRPGYMSKRNSALSDITSGQIEDKAYLWVDPSTCQLWEHHNRRYDLLNEEKCADLIEGLKSQGRQEIPAIVRAINNGTNIKYEVIAGARRHWAISWLRANNYPDFQYLIDVRDLTDEQAFRLSDMENRDREDISDYERSLDYKKAISLYYDGVASRMAERIGYTNANLNYLLKLADLPEEIVSAFLDITEITINNGRQLAPLLKDRHQRSKLLSRANELAIEQATRKEKEENLLSGKEVMSQLVSSTKEKVKKAETKTYTNRAGETILSITDDTKKDVKISIRKKANSEELKEILMQFLEDNFSNK